MATAATTPPTRPHPPAARRNTTSSPSPTLLPPRNPSLRRNSTATSPPSRRPPPKQSAALSPLNGDSREALAASLKLETDQKEQLMVQIQNKDQTIAQLTAENDNLVSALNAAESRLNDLYAEQSRSEAELAQRIDIADKLRAQVRELEKEKRDLHRRYNEQTATFEAERQAFYDNEQHLKSRIQSLTQTRKHPESIVMTHTETDTENDTEDDTDMQYAVTRPETPKQDLSDPETEPAEMTALRLELSTLSTSYASLQSTLVLLQTQLVDLKRVNREVQEENESYMILLREKTLSGQYDVTRQIGGTATSSDDDEDEDSGSDGTTDIGSLRSTGRTLDRVPEEGHEDTLEQELERSLHNDEADDDPSQTPRHSSRQARKRSSSTVSGARGESLAGLPITGPGLDLAAELGRAENKDILNGNIMDEHHSAPKSKRSRKGTESRKVSTSESGNIDTMNDIDALRSEVKSLKDANKALSLYASKIIDRIIAQEGFEHVLAADYERQPVTPTPAKTPMEPAPAPAPSRPQSVFMGRTFSNSSSTSTSSNSQAQAPPPTATNTSNKAQRRSLSFDWRGFSIFSGEKKADPPNLRPLTLKPGANPIVSARKLETQEDEEDRKERERLNATMKLMGIQPSTPASPQMPSTPAQKPPPPSTPLASMARRFSLFGARTPVESEASSLRYTPSVDSGSRVGLGIHNAPTLTQEALVNAEAENSIAALDAHERTLSAEVAKGAPSGFTEIQPRSSLNGRRSRRSAGGSGSTVWSAGMSDGRDEAGH
ncbi:hypothetical protein AX16_009576 [Volvariella volvacea WC 439]|nr:hypothetical protein AX16_009576 [Volvariella volvacea WC 439]